MTDSTRSEIIRRIDQLDRGFDRLAPADVAAGLESVRRAAAAHAMHPTVDIIHLLGTLLAQGERGALVRDWFAVLRESAASEATDLNARRGFTAACAVRLSA